MTVNKDYSKIILGGNVFGWTVDQAKSLQLLDYALEHGIHSIDTADMYQTWVTGHRGGESEAIIGEWLKGKKSQRNQIQIITKVGAPLSDTEHGLSAKYIKQAAEASLRRLKTDYIDLYFSHYADPKTAPEETLRAYEDLLTQGKIRAIGASNFSPEQLEQSLLASHQSNLPQYEYFQPGYNLVNRQTFEHQYQPICEKHNLKVMTYYSLAAGFLTGKYRKLEQIEQSARKGMILKYLNENSLNVLKALDILAEKYGAQLSEISLAWLMSKPIVTAPIASATSEIQIDSLLNATQLQLADEDVLYLDRISFW